VGASVSLGMSLIILTAAALATTLPCLFVWVADLGRRPRMSRLPWNFAVAARVIS
jgi:hypothetical protein